jgi:hypothetical protein
LLVFSSLFIVQFFFFDVVVSQPRGLCWFILGLAGKIHSSVWSAKCPQGSFGAGATVVAMAAHVFSQWNVALSSECQSFASTGALFLPSVAPASQQGFGVMELMLSGSAP